MKRGLFIVFEGPDGSGQSTQANLLANWFEKKGQMVFVTKEPTNSIVGGIIRTVLKKEWKIHPKTLALLFVTDRSHHVHTEIKPLTKKGVIVISDRYILSTLAFESDDVDLEWLKQINSLFPKPDITFILNVPGRICFKRIGESRFGFQFFENVEGLEFVRRKYLELKDVFPNTHVIKGYERTPKEIHEEIIEIVEKFCKEKGYKI